MPRRTDLTLWRRELEGFLAQLSDLYYRNLVGELPHLDTSAIFREYSSLLRESAYHDVAREAQRASFEGRREDRRVLLRLSEEILGMLVSKRFRKEYDELQTIEATSTLTLDGEVRSYREYSAILMNEWDRKRRQGWRDARDRVRLSKILPRQERLILREEAYLYDKLGVPREAVRFERAKGFRLSDLAPITARLLQRTERRYREAFEERLERAFGISLSEAEGHDFAPLRRAPEFDPYFPKDSMVEACLRTHRKLGFDLRALPQLRLDLEARPGKATRAFVYPVRVPSDVRLVTYPLGGYDDWRALFHESGHAVHFAFTDPTLPFEDRYLGEYGVTETYAFLFENLLRDPLWLKENTNLPEEKMGEYLAHVGAFEVRSLRYYCGSFAYDSWLARRRGLEGAPERYVKELTSALLYPARPEDYLETDGLYGTSYLRAWLLEALLRSHLKERFGEDWWNRKEAGDFLRSLFAEGTRPRCEEISERVGGKGRLDPRPLERDLERLLSS